ncbi:MAG: phosphatase [Bacteroidetes bacterium]|nr:phosphatase [Bacteroidota bacterium]
MSRIAVIDLGTNTFNLLIVDVDSDASYKHVFQTKISVKLAEGGMSKGFIAEVAFQRGLDALKTHYLTTQEYHVEKIHAFATSAIRGASNGQNFVDRCKAETNIDIQVISGDKEAELIYYGVRSAVEMSDDTSLIIDIGGGSTEFIIANKEKIFWKKSFLLGAARLLELFPPSDPMTDSEIENLTLYLERELQPLTDAINYYPVRELIGSSGSFDSLAEMVAHRFYTPEILDNKTEFTFDLQDCEVLYESILKSTKADRLKMEGLVAMRVDMIVVSSLIVNFVIRSFDIEKMRLSTYSLKEGVLHELMNS